MQLYENGFLKFADATQIGSLKSDLIDSFDIYSEDNNKFVQVDAEELAEFSFEFFMANLNKILEKRKFFLDVKAANDHELSHKVLINDSIVQLYTKEELEKEDFWDTAPRNFFKEVNRQLQMSQIDESFYLLYGGNDLCVLLLTEHEQKIIAEKYADDIKAVPYLP